MKGPVVLLGPPGAGKSTAGRAAAERLGMPFHDLDEQLSGHLGEGQSADEIFRREGETSFRVRELEALEASLDGSDRIVAAGAGIVDTARGRALLEARASCVRLEVDEETALARLQGSPRPWLVGLDEAGRAGAWRARELPRRDGRARLAATAVPAQGTVDEVAGALAVAVDGLRPVCFVAPEVTALDERIDSAGAVSAARGSGHALVVAEEAVCALHRIDADLVVPGGEGAKSLAFVERVARALLERGARRETRIVAVGGGALLDAVGLCAALLLRGVPWVAVPTTLLSQVDAGIGGKTAVDLDGKKNLLGAFHPPVETVVAGAFLKTLGEGELRAGRAEMLKHAMLAADAPGDGAPRDDDFEVLRSLGLKTRVVRVDPQERGLRAALNLGHTLAHALEATAPAKAPLGHGEAVRHGLRAMLRLSVAHAGLAPEVARRLDARVLALGPLAPLTADAGLVAEALAADKKAGRFVLLRAPGLPVLATPPAAAVRAAIDAALRGA
jgi:shikimate kinase / 3-dehydroquinate synthase